MKLGNSFYVDIDGETYGPCFMPELKDYWRRDKINRYTYVYDIEGDWSEWKAIKDVYELEQLLSEADPDVPDSNADMTEKELDVRQPDMVNASKSFEHFWRRTLTMANTASDYLVQLTADEDSRSSLIEGGAVHALFALAHYENDRVLRNCATAIFHLSINEQDHKPFLDARGLNAIKELAKHDDEHILKQIASAMAYLTASKTSCERILQDRDILEAVVVMCKGSENADVRLFSGMALANLSRIEWALDNMIKSDCVDIFIAISGSEDARAQQVSSMGINHTAIKFSDYADHNALRIMGALHPLAQSKDLSVRLFVARTLSMVYHSAHSLDVIVGKGEEIAQQLLHTAELHETGDEIRSLCRKMLEAVVKARLAAATKLQATWKGFMTRKEVIIMRREYNAAAMAIQQTWRACIARKRVRQRRSELQFQRNQIQEYSAAKIQATWRMKKGREYYEELFARKTHAARIIQFHFRLHMPAHLKDRELTLHVNRMAVRIQSIFRGFYQRKKFYEAWKRKTLAATNIQRHYRGYQGRLIYEKKVEAWRILRINSSILMQKVYRGHIARRYFKALHTDFDFKRLTYLALRLQIAFRGYLGRKLFAEEKERQRLLVEIEMERQRIERDWRLQQERMAREKEEARRKKEMERKLLEKQQKAAVKIQSRMRGVITRKRVMIRKVKVNNCAKRVQRWIRKVWRKRRIRRMVGWARWSEFVEWQHFRRAASVAATKIQAVWRGFYFRQRLIKDTEKRLVAKRRAKRAKQALKETLVREFGTTWRVESRRSSRRSPSPGRVSMSRASRRSKGKARKPSSRLGRSLDEEVLQGHPGAVLKRPVSEAQRQSMEFERARVQSRAQTSMGLAPNKASSENMSPNMRPLQERSGTLSKAKAKAAYMAPEYSDMNKSVRFGEQSPTSNVTNWGWQTPGNPVGSRTAMKNSLKEDPSFYEQLERPKDGEISGLTILI